MRNTGRSPSRPVWKIRVGLTEPRNEARQAARLFELWRARECSDHHIQTGHGKRPEVMHDFVWGSVSANKHTIKSADELSVVRNL